MQTFVDEKTTQHRTLFEQLGTNHPWLAKELEDHKLLFVFAAVLYAAEDAFNLARSFCSLGFSMNDAFHEHRDSASITELHNFEATPEGLAITLAGAAVLVLFSSLGTYYAEADPVKDGLFFYALGVSWSYMRDMLKAMKWAYKGIRSTLLLILMLSGHTAVLYHILFPITIVFGVLAVLNRMAIRYMRNERKKMMKDNELLSAQIAAKCNALTVMKEIPKDDELPWFMHSLIAVQQGNTYDVYYVKKVEEHSSVQYGTEVKVKLEPITELDQAAFTRQLHTFQNEVLCQQESYLLAAEAGKTLHFCKTLPLVDDLASQRSENGLRVDAAYQNTVIYLFDPTLASEQRVYLIDENGFAKLDCELSQRFEVRMQQARQDNQLLGVPHGQLDRIPALVQVLPPGIDHGCSYKEWSEYKAKIKYKKQSELLVIWCYAAVIYSALIDSLYFYMGVLFVATLNPHLFFAMLAMSSMLFVVCMLARIYEEYDYQRKLRRTQIMVMMTVCATECRFIELELERLSRQPQSREVIVETKDWLQKLFQQMESYETLHQQREKELVLGFWSALMLGITCGLGVQGVISALMFLIIAILTLTSTTCPPVLVFTFMSVGVACFLFSIIQFVVSYNHYLAQIKQQQRVLKTEEFDAFRHYLITLKTQGILKFDEKGEHIDESEDFQNWDWKKAYHALALFPHLQKNLLFNVKRSLDRTALDPLLKFDLLGWMEVWRIAMSGIVKFWKIEGELDRAHDYEETSAMFVVVILFSVLMGVMFGLRTVAKMFASPPKKENPTMAPPEETSYPKPQQPPESIVQCSSCGFFGRGQSNTSMRSLHSLHTTSRGNMPDHSPGSRSPAPGIFIDDDGENAPLLGAGTNRY